MAGYWIDSARGCPIGGPFDLWRARYFRENGVPPEDSVRMYPGLGRPVVEAVAVATVSTDATLDDVLIAFEDRGPADELEMAYAYFCEWRKHSPFMPEWAQDIPLRSPRAAPESLEERPDDVNAHEPQSAVAPEWCFGVVALARGTRRSPHLPGDCPSPGRRSPAAERPRAQRRRTQA